MERGAIPETTFHERQLMRTFILSVCLVIAGGIFLIAPLTYAQQQPESAQNREYVIGAGDSLSVDTGEPQYSGKVDVRPDGRVTIRHLGDIQAAGFTISQFRTNLRDQLKTYLKDPRVTVTLLRSSKTISVTFTGVISRKIEIERGTTLYPLLRDVAPRLRQMQPPPNLADIQVIGGGEKYPVNGNELLGGNTLEYDIRLEWGDTIYIPPQDAPTPVPEEPSSQDMTTRPQSRTVQQATLTPEQFTQLQEQYPETAELLQTLAEQSEDHYSIDMANMSEEQQQQLGPELLTQLAQYAVERREEVPQLTNMFLVGINVNLTYEPPLEAFLAIPDPDDPAKLPEVRRFVERDVVKPGETEEEDDILLEEIRAAENMVILRKGEQRQPLPLTQPFSQARLSGILDLGRQKKAFFTHLETSAHRRITTRGGFTEGEEISDGVEIASITEKWVILKQDQNLQLVFLRDSLNRPAPKPQQPSPDTASSGARQPQPDIPANPMEAAQSLMPPDMKENALPPQMQAVNTLSTLMFATPLF